MSRPDAIFSALTAASISVAQVTKLVYPKIIPDKVEAVLRSNEAPFGNGLDQKLLELDRPFVAGVGAVGCALIYALIVANAKGRILLLDPDKVNDSNLMRYILFDSRHLNQSKVSAAVNLIKASGIALRPEADSSVIQSYLEGHETERQHMRMVVSAVDSYEARRDIAGLLPREILNAGTTARDFTISRHAFADNYACLACLYPVQDIDVQAEAVMARELGLTKEEVINMKRTKQGLTAELLDRVSRVRGEKAGFYQEYIGEPLGSFYNKVACGTMPIRTNSGEAVAPLAYGSALAGFWLAQALVTKNKGENRHFRMDFIRGLSTPQRRSHLNRSDCLVCGRSVYRQAYRGRWS